MPTSPIEITATIFGFLCVWLTIRENIWCWAAGLVQVSLYIYVFHEARLYSDMILHGIYVVLQFYGWYQWTRGGPERAGVAVTLLTARSRASWAGVGVLGTAGLGLTMSRFTNASLPYWDAATTVLSLIAQWLMARKVLESWLIWILVDVLCIGIYVVKALHPTAVLYACFLIMATMGFFAWKRNLAPA